MNSEIEKLRLHFVYCSIILVLVIIAIATDRWTEQQKFTEYLSNAATMTSLVLGLVAIFYSFIANDGLSKSLGNINTISETISQTKERISEYLGLTEAATAATRISTDEMRKLSDKVEKDLAALNETLRDIGKKSELLHGSISALPSRLDQLESNVLDATKAVSEKIKSPQPTDATPQALDSAVVKRFLELAPMSGNLLAIACVSAASTKRPLVIADFTAAIDEKIDSYMSGFLASMDAAQLIKREVMANRSYTIKSVHEAIDKTAKTYFVDYLERVYKDKPEIKTLWLAKLSKVEAIFA